jgi:hypothetical protein
MGNSHTIGTADFAGAYTGLTHFNKYTTGFLAFLMVFTGPFTAYLGSYIHMIRIASFVSEQNVKGTPKSATADTKTKKVNVDVIESMFVLLIIYRCSIMIVSIVVTWIFQHHLFVWSVFAPKFIYEICQSLVIAFLYCCISLWFTIVQMYNDTFEACKKYKRGVSGSKKTV